MSLISRYLIFCLLSLCSLFNLYSQRMLDYVNPFIGTTNFGTTNPGAIVPNGMVSVVPFNVTGSEENKWDKDKRWWSTPYSWDNKYLTGFSHVNLSGVGCPDLGVILIMPTTGKVNANLKEYGAIMTAQNAEPGYYSCQLNKYRVKAELTSTLRTGLSKFTFPKGQSNILIDLGNGLTNESGGYIKIVSNQEVEGWRMTGNFCYHGQSERPVYFVARFSKPAMSFGAFKKMPAMFAEADWSSSANQFKYYDNYLYPVAGDSIGAYFTFETQDNEVVMVQLGVSYVSTDNARENLNSESNRFDFSATKIQAQSDWESVLSKIRVEGGTQDQKIIFYTALYHMHIHPNIISDVNGEYPKMESHETGKVESSDRYTTFSLWDTYRNFHPFMSLVYPDKQMDMVRTMIDMYKESAWLPKWELNGKETYTMNGDPAFPVITDTYLRGLTDFDIEAAYEAMLKHATTPGNENKLRPDNDFYLEHGYLPLVSEFDNSTSVALEYYLADWNLARLSQVLGKAENYHRFLNQSLGYKKYFDKEFGMIRPKLADGSFYKPFNPLQGKDFEPVPGFHEGTAWQYAFGVPHDIDGLMKLMGGEKAFTKNLQAVFDKELFDMANEPDMHYPFLFNYVKGEEWRAQKETLSLINKHFHNSPNGLPGNDDCGTMSAWLAFSMMGIYPVCPGDMNYAITTPVFDKVEILLNSEYYQGKSLVIEKTKTSNYPIEKLFWNGKSLNKYFINHSKLTKGGVLKISTK